MKNILQKDFQNVDESFYLEQRSQQEGRKNNNSYRTTISFLGNFYFSSIDQISWSLFHSKLKYDTPSAVK